MATIHGEGGGAPKTLGDVERGAVGRGNGGEVHSSSMGPNTAPPKSEPAPMRNLYTAALSYNGFTITDGALRLIVLLHAADLGFNAIEIAFMFSMYEVAGVFTNLFGGVAGSRYGLRCTLLTSLVLQMACLAALTQTEPILGDLSEATSGSTRYLEATIYITAWQALAGVAKDLMKLTGKSTPKLVTKDGAEGRLFQLVAWLTGMKNALKGFGHFLGALLVARIGYVTSLWLLVGFCAAFVPVGTFGMDRRLGISAVKKMEWGRLFRKGRDVNVLSAARFFLFGSRDVWFEIGLPLFLRVELGWERELVGLILAGYIVVYGNLQAASTKLYKNRDGTSGRPTSASAYKWAAYCSLAPLLTGIGTYFTHTVADNNIATAFVLISGLSAFAAMFAVNSSVHSYLIVSYSNKDKVAMDLGFYYMANAMGRLVGTLVGGFLYYYTSDDFGLSMCLLVACPFLVAAAVIAFHLPDPVALPSFPAPPSMTRSIDDVRGEAKKQEEVTAATAVANNGGSNSSSPSGLLAKPKAERAGDSDGDGAGAKEPPPHDAISDGDDDEGDGEVDPSFRQPVASAAAAVVEEDGRNVSGPLGGNAAGVAEFEAEKGAKSAVFESLEGVPLIAGKDAQGVVFESFEAAPATAEKNTQGVVFESFEAVYVTSEKGAHNVFDSLEGFPAAGGELPPPRPPPLPSVSAGISGVGASGVVVNEATEMPTE